MLRLVRRLARVRIDQVGAVPILEMVPDEAEVREAHMEAMAEAALGGHELGDWKQAKNGWQA